ncbi:MAG TPA: hypothetical protein VMN36_06305 [Verrucomicrobiales bacterium]|nr:hypothetical protein [Verrucomicrobiales bacterium]
MEEFAHKIASEEQARAEYILDNTGNVTGVLVPKVDSNATQLAFKRQLMELMGNDVGEQLIEELIGDGVYTKVFGTFGQYDRTIRIETIPDHADWVRIYIGLGTNFDDAISMSYQGPIAKMPTWMSHLVTVAER